MHMYICAHMHMCVHMNKQREDEIYSIGKWLFIDFFTY